MKTHQRYVRFFYYRRGNAILASVFLVFVMTLVGVGAYIRSEYFQEQATSTESQDNLDALVEQAAEVVRAELLKKVNCFAYGGQHCSGLSIAELPRGTFFGVPTVTNGVEASIPNANCGCVLERPVSLLGMGFPFAVSDNIVVEGMDTGGIQTDAKGNVVGAGISADQAGEPDPKKGDPDDGGSPGMGYQTSGISIKEEDLSDPRKNFYIAYGLFCVEQGTNEILQGVASGKSCTHDRGDQYAAARKNAPWIFNLNIAGGGIQTGENVSLSQRLMFYMPRLGDYASLAFAQEEELSLIDADYLGRFGAWYDGDEIFGLENANIFIRPSTHGSLRFHRPLELGVSAPSGATNPEGELVIQGPMEAKQGIFYNSETPNRAHIAQQVGLAKSAAEWDQPLQVTGGIVVASRVVAESETMVRVYNRLEGAANFESTPAYTLDLSSDLPKAIALNAPRVIWDNPTNLALEGFTIFAPRIELQGNVIKTENGKGIGLIAELGDISLAENARQFQNPNQLLADVDDESTPPATHFKVEAALLAVNGRGLVIPDNLTGRDLPPVAGQDFPCKGRLALNGSLLVKSKPPVGVTYTNSNGSITQCGGFNELDMQFDTSFESNPPIGFSVGTERLQLRILNTVKEYVSGREYRDLLGLEGQVSDGEEGGGGKNGLGK